MSKQHSEVTVICADEALAKAVRASDTQRKPKAVLGEPPRPVYEYSPALYIHSARWLEGPQLPPAMNAGSTYLEAVKALEPGPFGHYQPDLPTQCVNILAGIKRGHILAVAFAEPLWIKGTQSEATPVYTPDFLVGLLPSEFMPGQQFKFTRQHPPDEQRECASGHVAPWVGPLLGLLAPQICVRIDLPPDALTPLRQVKGPAEGETPRERASRRIRQRITGKARRAREKASVEPLVVNKVGQILAVAVRMEQGAVLVLPECRDEAAKAKAIRLLATDLWPAVQEWLRRNRVGFERRNRGTAGVSEPRPTPARALVPVAEQSQTKPKGKAPRWPKERVEAKVRKSLAKNQKQFDNLVRRTLEGDSDAANKFRATFGPTAIAKQIGNGCDKRRVHDTEVYRDKIAPLFRTPPEPPTGWNPPNHDYSGIGDSLKAVDEMLGDET